MPNPSAPLDADAVRAAVAGTRFADVRYVAQTLSTNADAQALLGHSTSLGTTIVAEYQSAGVGRKGRRWFAPAGSALLFTTILPEPIDTATLWAVPFWIAVALASGVEACCGLALELVWPNDLYLRGAGKVAGVLSVARLMRNDAWIGCGVGINVHRPAYDADLDALNPQPSFLAQHAADVKREPLLVAILRAFNDTFAGLRDAPAVAAAWEQRARLRGTIYRYRNDADGLEREGIAQRLGSFGSLIVRDASGEHTVNMADVRVIGRTVN